MYTKLINFDKLIVGFIGEMVRKKCSRENFFEPLVIYQIHQNFSTIHFALAMHTVYVRLSLLLYNVIHYYWSLPSTAPRRHGTTESCVRVTNAFKCIISVKYVLHCILIFCISLHSVRMLYSEMLS